jgi:hypothetical protein
MYVGTHAIFHHGINGWNSQSSKVIDRESYSAYLMIQFGRWNMIMNVV